jgi:hypothetical protein
MCFSDMSGHALDAILDGTWCRSDEDNGRRTRAGMIAYRFPEHSVWTVKEGLSWPTTGRYRIEPHPNADAIWAEYCAHVLLEGSN